MSSDVDTPYKSDRSRAALPLETSDTATKSGVTRLQLICGIIILAVALLFRLLRYHQSLWCDEMGTLAEYVNKSWRVIVAAGPGEYLPNNHVLFTLLAKACFIAGGRPGDADSATVLIRLPALLAGTLVPVALAWPLRRVAPALALLLAMVAAVHPWLIAESDEARGYSLMVLLGILATQALPEAHRRWPVLYGLLLAATVYTVPVALLLVAAHGVYVVGWRRDAVRTWARGGLIAAVAILVLYLPMARGMIAYGKHPLSAPADFGGFVDQLCRFAGSGQYFPATYDPSQQPHGFNGSSLYWLIPLLLVAVGMRTRPKGTMVRPVGLIMGLATAIAIAGAAASSGFGQVRFAPWAGVCVCVGVAVLLDSVRRRFGRVVFLAAFLTVIGWMAWTGFTLPPDQPIREALQLADQLAPAGTPITAAFLNADGGERWYGDRVSHHPLSSATTPAAFIASEARTLAATGHRPWLVISYEYLVHDYAPDAWLYLTSRYRVVTRLPGRITSVAIYAPRD